MIIYYNRINRRKPIWLGLLFMLVLTVMGFLMGYFYSFDDNDFVFYSNYNYHNILYYISPLMIDDNYLTTSPSQYSLFDFSNKDTDPIISWDIGYYKDDNGQMIPVLATDSYSDDSILPVSNVVQLTTGTQNKFLPTDIALKPIASNGVQVVIYNTHTAESYADKKSRPRSDGRGDVVLVASELERILENKYGIDTYASITVHDSPDWSRSYNNSAKTLKRLKQKYPNAKLFIDLHRDALPKKSDSTTTINGLPMAKMLIVIGSNRRYVHPNWQQNWETGKKLGAEIKFLDKDIFRGVRVQNNRYNQHLSPNAIIVEVGSDKNILGEAQNSMQVLAKAINNYINK